MTEAVKITTVPNSSTAPVIPRQRQRLEHGARPQLRQVQVGHGFDHHAHRGAKPVGDVKVIADEHDHERAQHGKHLIPRALTLNVQRGDDLVRHRLQQRGHEDDHAVPEAEGDVLPARPVPDADDKKRDQRGHGRRQDLADVVAEVLLGVAAPVEKRLRDRQRVEQVVAQPVAERDVPAVPVLGECAREVRPAEVFAHGDAEHLRHAARDVDAAGEVGIELQRVHERGQQHVRAGVVGVRPGDGVDHAHGAVGDDELLEKAPQDQLRAVADVVKAVYLCSA